MKHFLISFLLILLCVLCALAQEPADTIAAQELQEVTIAAPKVVRKADMDLYFPSESAMANAKDGMQLLANLMIPSLSVSDALGRIQAAGQDVQVRINGRQATIDQVRRLLPETVKRVEWIDNPGLRYGGANHVLNFIVANPTLGGSLMASARPVLNQEWGYYFADLKLNNGKSQWSVGGNFKLTSDIKAHRDYSETFMFPDDRKLTRKETSLGGELDNSMLNTWASYNYVKPDTTVFVAEFSLFDNLNNKTGYEGLLSLSDGSADRLLNDVSGDKGVTPNLALYLQQNFARNQMLVIDFSASYYNGRTFSDYLEHVKGVEAALYDIHTHIRDRNQAYSVEADYIKNWKMSKLTAGVSYTANRNRSEYVAPENGVFHQRQDRVYFFAEYFQRLGKWTLTAGMGAQYNNYKFRESNSGSHSWSPRPQATLTYKLNSNHNFRLNFTSWQSNPTLMETNVVPQQLDGFQWRVGNQNLKTSSSYMLTFSYGYNLPRINGSFGVRAFTSPDAITPILFWENDRLVTTYENSRGLKNLSFYLAPQIEVVPGWLNVSGYLQFRTERMRGTGYSLSNSGWSGHAALQLMHYGFVLSAQYVRAQRDLWGEKISWGEDINIIQLSYNMKNWQFGAGVIMPFGKYDQGSRSLSKWNTNEQHMRIDMRMPYIQISYNLQWGRQKRGAEKLVNSSAAADRSTAGGR